MPTIDLIVVAVAQTLTIFLFLVLTLRLIGRRTMAQLTLGGYLIVALLGSAVESGLYAGSSALAAGLASVTTLLVADKALSVIIQRSPRTRELLVGAPIVLVHDGQVVRDHMRQSQLTRQDLAEAIRMHGYAGLDDVRYVVLESDGSITVIPNDDQE